MFILPRSECSWLMSQTKVYIDAFIFEKESSFCILCGLCVRYCTEVKHKKEIPNFFFISGLLKQKRGIVTFRKTNSGLSSPAQTTELK